MQKLVVARALALQPQVLVAANPTRGLDVAATQIVHAAFRAALLRGAAVVLISTDLDEIVTYAHRAAVLYRGKLSAALAQPIALPRLAALMAGSAGAATG
jgi:simple sugar transport system ATP-binding protein